MASAGSDHRCDARRGVSDCGDGTCLKMEDQPEVKCPIFMGKKDDPNIIKHQLVIGP